MTNMELYHYTASGYAWGHHSASMSGAARSDGLLCRSLLIGGRNYISTPHSRLWSARCARNKVLTKLVVRTKASVAQLVVMHRRQTCFTTGVVLKQPVPPTGLLANQDAEAKDAPGRRTNRSSVMVLGTLVAFSLQTGASSKRWQRNQGER